MLQSQLVGSSKGRDFQSREQIVDSTDFCFDLRSILEQPDKFFGDGWLWGRFPTGLAKEKAGWKPAPQPSVAWKNERFNPWLTFPRLFQ